MSLDNNRPHPLDGPKEINVEWFDYIREKYMKASRDTGLSEWVRETVDALEAFWDQSPSAEDGAYSITHPLAILPVPSLGTGADDTVALRTFWYIVVEALNQWPPSRRTDLLDLVSAIKQLPKTIQIHNGEATDLETRTRPRTWDQLPYITMVWDEALREPGEIVLQTARRGTPELSQNEYVRRKDIEAQMIAREILPFNKRTVGYVGKTLEQEPDKAVPVGDADAYEQNRIEFRIPVVASLMKYCGQKLADWVVRQDQDQQRWTRWKERLKEIADNESDDSTRAAARVAYVEMQALGA